MSETRIVEVRVPAPGRIKRVPAGGQISALGWTIEADEFVYKHGVRVGVASTSTALGDGSGFIEYVETELPVT